MKTANLFLPPDLAILRETEEAEEEVREAEHNLSCAKEDAKDPQAASARAQRDLDLAETRLAECQKYVLVWMCCR